jgi:sugar O-acyltransferase (sialic acid O-acetyltransferase NeuD family)
MRNIVVIGASGHGKVVLDALIKQGGWSILGFLDGRVPVGTMVEGFPVVGRDNELALLGQELECHAVGFGIGDNSIRRNFCESLRVAMPGVTLPTIIHPASVIARGVQMGEGTVVVAGVVINSSATVGRGCILNTKSSLGHDSEMEDFASLAPGVTVGGESVIGRGTAIGIGATVLNRVRIGADTVVGAGSTVIHDLPSGVIAYGTPARVIRDRLPQDPYLISHVRHKFREP